MRIFTYLFIIIIVLAGLTFACLNAQPVAINYYVGVAHPPLALLLALALGFGCLLGLSIGLIAYLRLHFSNRRLRSRLQATEQELNNLRTMPLQDRP